MVFHSFLLCPHPNKSLALTVMCSVFAIHWPCSCVTMHCQPEPTVFCPPLSTGDAWGSQDLDFSLQHPWELSYTSSIGMSFGDPVTTPFKSNLGSMYLGPSGQGSEKKKILYFLFLCLCMDHLSVSFRIWFFLHYFPCGHVGLSGSCSQLHSCRDLSAFSHLPEAWEMHSLSSSPLYSPHGSGFVACWSMGPPSFCPFLVFSHTAVRLQIDCAISVFTCNPAARFPSHLPLGTYKNTFA